MRQMILYFIVILCGILNPAFSTLLLEENFNFSGLLTANGWAAHSSSGVSPISTTTGLTYAGYPSSGIGQAALLATTGEDVNRGFTAQTAGSIYFSFLVSTTSSSLGYFFHTSDPMPSTTFRGKVFITSDGTGDFEFALTMSTNTPTAITNGNYSFNTTYLVVLKYTIVAGTSNDNVSLFVFSSGMPPVTEPAPTLGPITETVADLVSIGYVELRQHTAGQGITVDGIRIADTWLESTTLIDLVSFSAIPKTDNIQIAWQTASELDNAGFHLWRATEASPYTLITNSLIPAQGTATTGASYDYKDYDIIPGTRYSYKLEDIDVAGKSGWHGPVNAECK